MHKLSMACLIAGACMLTSQANACPLTDGIYADTGCMAEALENTVKAHGLLKIPTTVDDMRQTLYAHQELRKEYAERLRTCLARTHDCAGPMPSMASPIEEMTDKIVSVVHCGKGAYLDLKTFKTAEGDLYCPSGTECKSVQHPVMGHAYSCMPRGYHMCHGRSVSIACPRGWACEDSGLEQTCRKR